LGAFESSEPLNCDVFCTLKRREMYLSYEGHTSPVNLASSLVRRVRIAGWISKNKNLCDGKAPRPRLSPWNIPPANSRSLGRVGPQLMHPANAEKICTCHCLGQFQVISIHFCNPSSPAASLRIKDTRPGQALGPSVTQKMMDSGLAHQVGRSITGGIRYPCLAFLGASSS
jgi:hypothetical protein